MRTAHLGSLLAALAAGLVFGVAGRLLALGPELTLWLSNVAALWLALAFVAGAGARAATGGAAAGALALVAAWAGYYGWMNLVEDQANAYYLRNVAARWLVLAIPAGMLLGALGARWRVTGSALAALPLVAALAAEAVLALARYRPERDMLLVYGAELAAATLLAVLLITRRPRASLG